MYAQFYGFRDLPFRITPDPRLLYRNACYEEAAAALAYGIQHRKGFLSLVGEAGTGKTTLLRHLLDTLPGTTRSVLLLYPTVTFDEVLEFILQELGVPTEGARKLVLLQRLHEFLLEHTHAGGNVALLIDEAQDLDANVLEELRLLSNLETGSEKILQILLAGQPELERKLAQPNLRQLRQRIAMHVRLRPLAVDEVEAYVRTRLGAVGGDPSVFAPEAIARIAQVSHGIPRIVNVLCDACLVTGVAAGTRRVTREIVEEAWADYARLLPSDAEPSDDVPGTAAPESSTGVAPAGTPSAAVPIPLTPPAAAPVPSSPPAPPDAAPPGEMTGAGTAAPAARDAEEPPAAPDAIAPAQDRSTAAAAAGNAPDGRTFDDDTAPASSRPAPVPLGPEAVAGAAPAPGRTAPPATAGGSPGPAHRRADSRRARGESGGRPEHWRRPRRRGGLRRGLLATVAGGVIAAGVATWAIAARLLSAPDFLTPAFVEALATGHDRLVLALRGRPASAPGAPLDAEPPALPTTPSPATDVPSEPPPPAAPSGPPGAAADASARPGTAPDVAPGGPTPADVAQAPPTQDEALALIRAFQLAYEDRDVDRLMALFAVDATENDRSGHDRIAAAYRDAFAHIDHVRYALDRPAVTATDGRVVVRGPFRISYAQPPAGHGEMRGTATWEIVRRDGRPRIATLRWQLDS